MGGGLVLTATGWSLLSRTHDDTPTGETVGPSHRDWLQRSFYPLTLPLTVGPGSLSVAVTLGANAPSEVARQGVELVVASVLAPALIGLAVYISYRWSERLERLLGESAMSVFLRLSSLILLCIGVQILWNGVSALWLTLPR